MAEYEMSNPRPWDKPELLERLYWGENMSMPEIAERWPEATKSSIGWQFEKHDIPTRSTGQAKRLATQHQVSLFEQKGRLWVSFGEYGGTYTFPLARLIAMSEWPLDELKGHDVHHKNGCPLDDRIGNFEVATRSEHIAEHATDRVPPKISTERRKKLAAQRDRDEHGRFD